MYSVNKITTVADADLLLTWAASEKADLDFKKLSETRLTTNYGNSSLSIDSELQAVLAEIATSETIIATLPAGARKEVEIVKKTKLEYKKFLLENRKESYGIVALLEKEVDLARVTDELTQVETFITAVTARKAAL